MASTKMASTKMASSTGYDVMCKQGIFSAFYSVSRPNMLQFLLTLRCSLTLAVVMDFVLHQNLVYSCNDRLHYVRTTLYVLVSENVSGSL